MVFCYYNLTFEWLLYFIIEILLIIIFIISCYIIDSDIKKREVTDLRFYTNIGIELSVIFIGIFLLYVYRNNGLTKLQLCFLSHVAPFLIITGISTLATTIKNKIG